MGFEMASSLSESKESICSFIQKRKIEEFFDLESPMILQKNK